ncbi:hypothetical protein QQF64_013567 [Cirrhinus molitorella]|uniref:Uncharacterized protein n=1 Tax=Cirrhinus molitorella TaxID=172907 RepID=A0ABR3LU50_9TELE
MLSARAKAAPPWLSGLSVPPWLPELPALPWLPDPVPPWRCPVPSKPVLRDLQGTHPPTPRCNVAQGRTFRRGT